MLSQWLCRAGCLLTMALSACSTDEASAPGATGLPVPGNVTEAGVLANADTGEQWPVGGGDFPATHYSPLGEVHRGNVSELGCCLGDRDPCRQRTGCRAHRGRWGHVYQWGNSARSLPWMRPPGNCYGSSLPRSDWISAWGIPGHRASIAVWRFGKARSMSVPETVDSWR